MCIIKSYRVEGKDLYFDEYLYWTFTPDQNDAVQIWKLTNVNEAELDKEKLDKIISFGDDVDIEQEVNGDRIKFTIFTYNDNSEYVFNCDKLTIDKRPYNIDELTSFILKSEQYNQDYNKTIIEQRRFINDLETFLYKEIDRKNRIIEQIQDSTNIAKIKAINQLDILRQLKNLFDNNKIN